MSHIWIDICVEMINLGATLLAAVIMRWLLGLSTMEKDFMWIRRTHVYKFVDKLKFYRGQELIHQMRARRVYTSYIG